MRVNSSKTAAIFAPGKMRYSQAETGRGNLDENEWGKYEGCVVTGEKVLLVS